MLYNTDYSVYADGAPAGHTHYGSGASSIGADALLTTGLTNGLRGGATLDGTSSSGFKRVRARIALAGVVAGSNRAGGVVLNYTHTVFAGLRVTCVYVHAAVPDNCALGVDVAGSRAGDSTLASEGFSTGGFLSVGSVIFVEAQYTPGVGAANGLVEFRAWPLGAAVPAYKNVAVHSSYATIIGPGGIADLGGAVGGSNARYLTLEVEGEFKNPALRLSLYPSGHVHARGAATEDAAVGPLLCLFPDGHVISYGGATIAEGASQASFTTEGLDCVAFHPGSLFP